MSFRGTAKLAELAPTTSPNKHFPLHSQHLALPAVSGVPWSTDISLTPIKVKTAREITICKRPRVPHENGIFLTRIWVSPVELRACFCRCKRLSSLQLSQGGMNAMHYAMLGILIQILIHFARGSFAFSH